MVFLLVKSFLHFSKHLCHVKCYDYAEDEKKKKLNADTPLNEPIFSMRMCCWVMMGILSQLVSPITTVCSSGKPFYFCLYEFSIWMFPSYYAMGYLSESTFCFPLGGGEYLLKLS